MKKYRFLQVDVFTDRPFGGNPLAVFPEAEGLGEEEMQSLAREMNLSETTFVLPSKLAEADYQLKIFTPAVELPFAGHPVVGTHWVLAHLGLVELSEPVTRVKLELGVGVRHADLHVVDGRVERVVMTQDRPTFHALLEEIYDLSDGLTLAPEAITTTGLPVQVVSTGAPQLMVPVCSLAEIQRLDPGKLDITVLGRVCRSLGTKFILVFTTETVHPGSSVHVRGFGHLLGVPEDPATGSANGALGAYLVYHRAVPIVESTVRIVSEQGLEMGRPSTLEIEVDHLRGEPTAVRVGGQVVLMAEGEFRF